MDKTGFDLLNVFKICLRAKLEEKRKKEEEKRMKEEEKRLKEERDVSSCIGVLISASFISSKSLLINICLLQRLKAEKAEITRFLQKPKIQQAPKVSRSQLS